MIKRLFKNYFELAFWIGGLIALAFANPHKQPHYSLCPLKLMGFYWCPGCGLGHSISFLFHGNITASFHAHWLGLPALAIILGHIFKLLKLRFTPQPAFGVFTR